MYIIGADHTSYTVSDLDRSLAFYHGVLGLGILWQREIDNPYFCEIIGFPGCSVRGAHLLIPGSDHHIELFEYVQPGGSKADVRTMNVGSSHVSLVVADLPYCLRRAESQGGGVSLPAGRDHRRRQPGRLGGVPARPGWDHGGAVSKAGSEGISW